MTVSRLSDHLEANYFTILYLFCHISTWICHRCTRVSHPESPSHLPPHHPSGSSQCTSPGHPVSCIEPGLAIRFTCDNLHVSMPFSQIIPPLPSPTESKRLFYTSVSLLLSHIQGYHYHLSKFHIYALVYCIGVFLSDSLHSVQQALGSSTSLGLTQICSFLKLSNIPLYMWTTISAPTLPSMDI